MRRRIRDLLVKGMRGGSGAYRELGLRFLRGRGCLRDRELGRLCLKRSMELGDEEAFFLYHRAFSQGKKVIDDHSYAQLCEDYRHAEDGRRRGQLRRYLMLGTKSQKERNKIDSKPNKRI